MSLNSRNEVDIQLVILPVAQQPLARVKDQACTQGGVMTTGFLFADEMDLAQQRVL